MIDFQVFVLIFEVACVFVLLPLAILGGYIKEWSTLGENAAKRIKEHNLEREKNARLAAEQMYMKYLEENEPALYAAMLFKEHGIIPEKFVTMANELQALTV